MFREMRCNKAGFPECRIWVVVRDESESESEVKMMAMLPFISTWIARHSAPFILPGGIDWEPSLQASAGPNTA